MPTDFVSDSPIRRFLGVIDSKKPKVVKVVFNGPATIVFWDDGEKTVVKCRECGDGECIHDKGFDLRVYGDKSPTVMLDDLAKLSETASKIARCTFCQMRFDHEKAIMAAMLKRLYPNFQDVLRDVLEDGDE